ncbi:hypothetical protein SLE2022_125690 [Rubroshorea leprosula]
MAVCKFNPTMAEQMRNECRDMIIPSFPHPPSRNSSQAALTFFFSIAVADHPKIRIKIPKVLVKAVLRKGNENNTGHGGDQGERKKRKRKLGKLKRIIPRKVCSMLSNVFSGGKSQERRYTDEWRVGKEKRGNKFRPMEQAFKGKNNGGEGSDGMVIVGKQGRSRRLNSRTLLSYWKMKKGRSSMRGNWGNFKQINGGETEQEEEGEEEEEEYELCKRRILMGGRCRPLNPSGFLQYDKDGILVPDILW